MISIGKSVNILPRLWLSRNQRFASNKLVNGAQILQREDARRLSDADIDQAKTVNDLLKLAPEANEHYSKKLLTRLGKLCVENDIDRKNVECDERFKKLVSNVTGAILQSVETNAVAPKSVKRHARSISPREIISQVATENNLIHTLDQAQLIKVLTGFSKNKLRNPHLLKSVAGKIVEKNESFSLKECSDILFASSVLNFYNSPLLIRTSENIQSLLQEEAEHASFVGSIVTSLGYLRYRDTTLIDSLGKWMIKHRDVCRPKDLASMVVTSAAVNFRAPFTEELLKLIDVQDLTSMEVLDFVWSLSVLNLASANHFEQVLSKEFVDNLRSEAPRKKLQASTKRKLLNLNGIAKLLIKGYDGSSLDSTRDIFEYPFEYSKNKKLQVAGLLSALKHLLSSDYIKTHVETKMGFVIDAACVLDAKQTPLSFSKENDENVFRIAFFVLDFPDVCFGDSSNSPCGYAALQIRLLESLGYHVLLIPPAEFSTADKLVSRVRYLDTKLKNIIETSSIETEA